MKIFNTLAVCALATALLSGAANAGPLDTVMTSPYPDDSSITIGEALETRKLCNSTKWNIADSHTVWYDCEISGFVLSMEGQDKKIADHFKTLKVYQTVDFFIDGDNVQLFSCGFELRGRNPWIPPLESVTITDNTVCLKESSKEKFDMFYYTNIKKLYDDHLDTLTK